MVFRVYTLTQVAQEIGCDHGRVRHWVQRGKLLPSQKIGPLLVFDDDALAAAKRLLAGEGMGRLAHLYRRLPIGDDLTGYMTRPEAAAEIGVDEATLARWFKAGRVQAYKPAGQERVLFARVDVERLAAERSGRAA